MRRWLVRAGQTRSPRSSGCPEGTARIKLQKRKPRVAARGFLVSLHERRRPYFTHEEYLRNTAMASSMTSSREREASAGTMQCFIA